MSTLNYLDSFYTFPSIYTHFSINIKTFCFHGDLYLFLFFFKEPLISFFKIFSLWEYKRELYDPYLICKRIKVPMDYDARKDSLLSEQESEKVEIYLSCRNVQASPLTCEIHLQEGNKPRKGVYSSKPTQTHHGRADFANSLIIEYFFECNSFLTKIDKNYLLKFSMFQGKEGTLSAEYRQLWVKYSMVVTKELWKRLTTMVKSQGKCS